MIRTVAGLAIIAAPFVLLAFACWPLSFYVWFWFELHPVRICIGCVLAPFAIIGAIIAARWIRAQHRSYSGVNHSIAWYMRPK